MRNKIGMISILLLIFISSFVFSDTGTININVIDPYEEPADGRVIIYSHVEYYDGEYDYGTSESIDYQGNVEFSDIELTENGPYLVVVDGRLDLGLNGVNYTYIREVDKLTDLVFDANDAKVIESEIINLPSDFSGYLFGNLKGIIYNNQNEKISRPIIDVTNISSSGFSSDTGWLDEGKYELIYYSDNIYMFLDNFRLQNNYDKATFDASEAAVLELDIKNWGVDEYRANEKRVILQDVDRYQYAGFPNSGEKYLITPGTYNLTAEYYETNGYGIIFNLSDKAFDLNDDRLKIGYNLSANLELEKTNYNTDEIIPYDFSIKDDENNILKSVYDGNIDTGQLIVQANVQVIDENGNTDIEYSTSLANLNWLNLTNVEEGNYELRITQDLGSYGIIEASESFTVGDVSNNNDDYDLFDSKVCGITKDWKITFNQALNNEIVTNDCIYVKDSEGNIIETELELSENQTVVMVKSPTTGYDLGNYNLYIENTIMSQTGMTLETGLRMEFTVK
jgi:hypothetical protein